MAAGAVFVRRHSERGAARRGPAGDAGDAGQGYPAEQFEERAKLVSVDHPELVQHFREAHAVAVADDGQHHDLP
jgi:hypothetical protein